MTVRGPFLLILLIFCFFCTDSSTGWAAPPLRMRPYTGVGLVVFSNSDVSSGRNLQLQLYEEPGLTRVGVFDGTNLSVNEWIFGRQETPSPLIVSAQKGNWLRVSYDDAGREAWIEPQNKGHFQTWEQFLKLQPGRMLSGLQPQLYELQQKPGKKVISTLTPKQVFKILKLDGSWGMVLTDQAQIGWLRWRDDDSRLTIGTGNN